MPCLTRTPINVAVRLLPIDQLSSGVCSVMPSPYRSAMRRPLHVTTKAAVTPAAGSKAASTACLTLTASSSGGSGSLGRTSPMGHACVEASGRWLLSFTGVKFTEFLPTGSVTHPWSPRYMAVRVTPFGSVMCTALWTRSMIGFPTFARSAYGLVKYPTFSAATSGSRPVMNTAEHMIFAKPDVWCSNGSPGGGTYGVSSSNDFARAIRAALVGSGSCDAAVLTARATTTGTSESLIMTISCDGIQCLLPRPLLAPRLKSFREDAVAQRTLFHQQKGPAIVIIDHRDIDPG